MSAEADGGRAVVTEERLPLITVVVPTLNEKGFISECVRSLLEQEGLDGRLEVLVVDGGSDDGTREIVRSLQRRDPRVRLLSNPGRIQTFAFNIGLRAARGEYIAFVGAHALYGPRYLAECLALARKSGATNVGGVQTAVGRGAMGRAIAWAMSSPFGVGTSTFRYATEDREVKSVFGGFLRVDDLRELGGFREDYRANEDYELNCRIRERGGKVVVSPSIRYQYFVRDSLVGLARQMARYGRWRVKTVTDHPRSLKLSQVGGSVLPLVLAVSILLAMTVPPRGVWLAIPTAYAAYLLTGGVVALRKSGSASVALRVPAVILVMHLSWGVGWWDGVRRFGVPWQAYRSLLIGGDPARDHD